MKKLAFASLLALASTAAAQNCFEPNFGTNIGGGDDVVLSGGPIGFNFPFNGQNYTDLYVSTNGFVYLANASTPVPTGALCCAGSTTNLVASLNPIVAPFWDDLNVIVGNGAGVYVNSSAGACVVTWDGVVQYGNTVPFQMQAQLLPSGEIRFTYSGDTLIRQTGDVLVGVSEGNGALLPAASDFSVPAATAAVTAFEVFNGTTSLFDMAGDSLSLVPTGQGWFHIATACRANAKNYGTGCVRSFGSFYETFPNGTFDLSNTSFQMVPTGTGYLVLPGTNAWFTPTSSGLPLTDDSVSSPLSLGFALNYPGGSTNDVYVSSNGFVWAQSNAANGCCTGTPATFLADGARWAPMWGDMNPAVGGSVHFDTDPANGAAYVTFLAVPEYGAPANTNTFQVAFFSSGIVEIRYQSCMQANRVVLTGWTPGGGAQDPGSIDLSASLPVVTGADVRPLALAAVGVPSFGATISLDTTNIPAGATFGATLMGLVEFNPGLDLSAFGMAGCSQYTDGSSTLLFVAPSGSVSQPFSVPANPAFFGFSITAQSAVFAPGTTALGAIASNGVRLTLGY